MMNDELPAREESGSEDRAARRLCVPLRPGRLAPESPRRARGRRAASALALVLRRFRGVDFARAFARRVDAGRVVVSRPLAQSARVEKTGSGGGSFKDAASCELARSTTITLVRIDGRVGESGMHVPAGVTAVAAVL